MPIYNIVFQSTPHESPPEPSPRALQLTGPVIPVQIEIPTPLSRQLQLIGQVPPTPRPGFALIDTGASVSAVDGAVVRDLGVQPVGIASVGTAGGHQQQDLYPARFVFPGTNIPSIEFSRLLGADLSGLRPHGLAGPLLALLGRDILERFVMFYHGPNGMVTLAY